MLFLVDSLVNLQYRFTYSFNLLYLRVINKLDKYITDNIDII